MPHAPMAGVTVDPAHRLSIRRNLAAAATALPKLAAMQSPKSTHIAQLLLQRIRAWHQHSKAVGHAIFWAPNRPGAPAWWPWARSILLGCAVAMSVAYAARMATVSEPRELADQAGLNGLLQTLMPIALCVALVMQTLHSVVTPWVSRHGRLHQRSATWRSSYYSAVCVLGLVLGWPLGLTIAHGQPPHWFEPHQALENVWSLVVIGAVAGAFFEVFVGAHLRQLAAEHRATESQLRLLQGQIEPHFLFNTLATVHSLIDQDHDKAKLMLDSFTDYLRSTTLQLRADDSTVGAELDLVEAYLRLQHVRMDDRLHFAIKADAGLRALPLPPLLLQPLVENAILHGIEPQVTGGHVQVTVARESGNLVITVRDTGRGLTAAQAAPRMATTARHGGTGVALANLRERLSTRYGSTASLAITSATPGTLARVQLPIPTATPAQS
jgi:two-component sensor histidine kinase